MRITATTCDKSYRMPGYCRRKHDAREMRNDGNTSDQIQGISRILR